MTATLPKVFAQHGYLTDKRSYLSRLRKIEGQARGLHRMVEADAYCIDIVTQVTAMKRALDALALCLLEDHMKHCVTAADSPQTDAAAKVEEALDAIGRLVRS